VQEKAYREALSKRPAEKVVSKHNPITNPIEYHIDNPYFLKRMQDRNTTQ
jgi:hypothetical protein